MSPDYFYYSYLCAPLSILYLIILSEATDLTV